MGAAGVNCLGSWRSQVTGEGVEEGKASVLTLEADELTTSLALS